MVSEIIHAFLLCSIPPIRPGMAARSWRYNVGLWRLNFVKSNDCLANIKKEESHFSRLKGDVVQIFPHVVLEDVSW